LEITGVIESEALQRVDVINLPAWARQAVQPGSRARLLIYERPESRFAAGIFRIGASGYRADEH
jgi:hypothetical protein